MHLDYALEGYWLSKRRNLSPNTQRDYELTFRRFLEFMGSDTEVEEITSDDVECFLNFLTDELGLSDKTVINHFIALSSFWTWAERNLEVPHIIRGRVECPRYYRPQIVPFTLEEVRALLEACEYKAPWDHKWAKDVRGGSGEGAEKCQPCRQLAAIAVDKTNM